MSLAATVALSGARGGCVRVLKGISKLWVDNVARGGRHESEPTSPVIVSLKRTPLHLCTVCSYLLPERDQHQEYCCGTKRVCTVSRGGRQNRISAFIHGDVDRPNSKAHELQPKHGEKDQPNVPCPRLCGTKNYLAHLSAGSKKTRLTFGV